MKIPKNWLLLEKSENLVEYKNTISCRKAKIEKQDDCYNIGISNYFGQYNRNKILIFEDRIKAEKKCYQLMNEKKEG
jgi:hypothetical protein